MSESKFPHGPSNKDPSSDASTEQNAAAQEETNTAKQDADANVDQRAVRPSADSDNQSVDSPLAGAGDSETDEAVPPSAEPPTVESARPARENDPGSHAKRPDRSEPSAAAAPPSPPGTARVAAIAALVAAIIGAGMVGAAAVYARQQQQQIQSELAALQNETQQQKQAVATLNRALQQQGEEVQSAVEGQLTDLRQQLQQQAQRQIQQQEAQISRLKDRVDGHQQRLASLSTTSREDWLLAEAEYLLKLANQRVLLERLPNNAIALLEAADAIIRQVAGGMGDAELFAIREALADELAELKMVESVDKEGLYLQLNALARQVDDLPRVPGHSFDRAAQKPGAQATEDMDEESAQSEVWWQRLWDEVKNMAGLLDDYIKIESADTPVQPLVDQHTSQAAVLNVRLLLEQAQVALLKEQSVAYRQSLQQAQAMIDDYFIASPQAREVRQSLKQLEQVEIAPQLPDISASLKMLNAYVQQLHRLQPAAEGQL